MKKAVTRMLAAVPASCAIAFCALFRTAAANENVPMLSASECSAQPGETVSVLLDISHNPGIAALSLSIEYDADRLTLLGAESKTAWPSAVFLAGGDSAAHPYILNWDSDGVTDYTADGQLAELQFAVREDADGDAEISVSVNQESTFRVFGTKNGIIHISRQTTAPVTTTEAVTTTESTAATEVTVPVPQQPDYLRGDVDNNGTVDVADAQITLNAYTQIMTNKSHGLTEAEYKAANVNYDEELSVTDAQLILQYYTKISLAEQDVTWEALIP